MGNMEVPERPRPAGPGAPAAGRICPAGSSGKSPGSTASGGCGVSAVSVWSAERFQPCGLLCCRKNRRCSMQFWPGGAVLPFRVVCHGTALRKVRLTAVCLCRWCDVSERVWSAPGMRRLVQVLLRRRCCSGGRGAAAPVRHQPRSASGVRPASPGIRFCRLRMAQRRFPRAVHGLPYYSYCYY